MSKPFYEAGPYVGEVLQQGLTKTESSGNMQFVVRFKIMGRPDPSDNTILNPCAQYERTVYMTITEKTVGFIVDNLRKMGYPDDSFGPLDPSHSKHYSFVGQQVDLYCKHENDQNNLPREKWQISRGAQSMELKPLESKDVRQLDMLFGKALKSTSSPQKRQAPAASHATTMIADGTEITDDDIPF